MRTDTRVSSFDDDSHCKWLILRTVSYTGAVGDPVPIVKGWLRVSLRKCTQIPAPYRDLNIPWRDYLSTYVQPVELDTPYTVDIELWPTNVILAKGDMLVLEIASGDTAGSGIFRHDHPQDRPISRLQGWNSIHIGTYDNFLRLPVVPAESLGE